MFKMLNKLRGTDAKTVGNQVPTVYDKKGVKIEKNIVPLEMKKFWISVYKKHRNDVNLEWDDDQRKSYNAEEGEEQFLVSFNPEPNRLIIPVHLQEHFDVVDGLVMETHDSNTIYVNTQCYPAHLLEHVEVLNCQFVYKGFKRMKWVQWNEVDVSSAVKRIKNGKQPGPDLIKGEIIKWLIESKICLNYFLT